MASEQMTLAVESPSFRAAGRLSAAVKATLAALPEADDPQTLASRELALTLAEIIDHKRVTGRTSTVSNDARILQEILATLTGLDDPNKAGNAEQLRAAMREWSQALKVAK